MLFFITTITTQFANATLDKNDFNPGKIKWSNNDTIFSICLTTKLDTIYIKNEQHPDVGPGGLSYNTFSYTYYSKIGKGKDCDDNKIRKEDLEDAMIQWSIYNEKNEKIDIFNTFADTLVNNENFQKDYYQGKGSLPTIAINIVINKLMPGKYKIERTFVCWHDSISSNQLTLIIHNNHIKSIELLKNEPIASGDNIYLGYQKENNDSLYTINWQINNKENLTLTDKNLYQIDKDYTGKLNIKLQTTTNLTGCIAYDSIELNVTPKKIDTIYITDTIYIEKEPKTAIINKQTNLNIWPNPTTTFVNAEAEEPFSYTLLNNEGKILKKEEGESSYTIDMNEYSDGVYFIKTSDGITHKIIKE